MRRRPSDFCFDRFDEAVPVKRSAGEGEQDEKVTRVRRFGERGHVRVARY